MTQNEPDRELVRRAVSGDGGAFGELVERHEAVAHRVARRIVGPAAAAGVPPAPVQRALHRLARFRRASPFRAWLLQIVHNTALNALQRRRPEAMADPHASEEASGEPDGGGERQPARELEERERRERLELKLRGLRSEHRAVLVLRDLEGLAYEEIAAVTDTPLGSVKGRLHRARGELIELLRANSYDWELPE